MTTKKKRIRLIQNTNIVCYVCEKFKPTPDKYIGRNKENKRIFRHTKCFPGSAKWKNSNIAKKSNLYEILAKENDFYSQ